MKKAILVASFGTTNDAAREASIAELEREVAAKYPDFAVVSAFTSGMVIRALAKRDIEILTVTQALEQLCTEKIQELTVLPTHLVPGLEYDKLCKDVSEYSDKFKSVAIAKPLLNSIEDMQKLVAIVAEEYSINDGCGLALMGHGSPHFAGVIYPALAYMFAEQGHANIFVGAVEGYPEIESVIEQLKTRKIKTATLAPLMLVAGEHAQNDMAGDSPESWKSKLEACGIKVTCKMQGLGELDSVRKLYLEHLAAAMMCKNEH